MYVVVLFVEEDEGGKIIVSSPGSYRLAGKGQPSNRSNTSGTH